MKYFNRVLFVTGLILVLFITCRSGRQPHPSPVAAKTIPATSNAAPAVRAASVKLLPCADKKIENANVAQPLFEKDGDSFSVRCNTYSASVSAQDGLTYLPRQLRRSNSDSPPRLRVQLQRVECGAAKLFDRESATLPDVSSSPNGVRFTHAGSFEESYTPRGDGVEQTFTFEKLPEITGDLQFECAIAADGLSAQSSRAQRNGGISFMDEAGRFGVRYGMVTVHDSARHGIHIEPLLNAAGNSVRFVVPAAWLREAVLPIVVDPLVGSDFQVSPDNTVGVGAPAVIGGANNFLIIWDDYSNGSQAPRLFASVVTSTGVVSPGFQLSQASAAPRPYVNQRIEAAFDGTNWLVVWSQDETGGSTIHGIIIASGAGAQPAGSILGGTDFLIGNSTGTVEEEPLVAFDGIDFLVAWMSGPTGGGSTNGSQIYYTRVSSAGAVSPVSTVPANSTPPNQALLFLTPQTPGGDALLVYRENAEAPAATRATRIGQDGTLRDPGGITLFTEAQSSGGFGRPIGVAFVNTQWNILSSYDETQDSAVFQTSLSTGGTVTPPSGIFAIVGVGPTGTTIDQFAPVFSGPAGWLFLRNERVNNTVYHILGKRVAFDGTDQDPLPFQLDTATQGILRSAVGAQAGNFFCCAWLDGRRGATQPADAQNIFATIVDTTVADTGGPALVPFIAASPINGSAPLTVNFDSTGSSGSFDTLGWIFGDGARSTAPTVSHTYNNNGTYVAQLALSKGAYTVFRSVVIIVGGGSGPTGPGGTIIGTPLQNSGDLVPSLLISTAVINLDFTSQRNDSATITGTVDSNALPATITGTLGSVTIGTTNFPFTLDAKGTFHTSTGSAPMINFSVNPKKGTFTFQVTKADLQTTLAALGANNDTVKPAIFVSVPITLEIAAFSATVTEGMSYKATLNQSGKAVFSFLNTGKTITGSFVVDKFSCKQSGKTNVQHEFEIHGQLVRPNGGSFRPAASGQFTFGVGGYTVSVPAGQIIADKSGNLKFKARTGTVGLKKFAIAPHTGIFNMTLKQIPASGLSGSGMPISGTNIVNVQLAFSFQFDLFDGQITAGRYLLIQRKNADAKGWKLQ